MSEHDNGNRPSMAPEAVQALAEQTAAKQSADEAWIARVDEGVARVANALEAFEKGQTPWQRDISAQLKTMANQMMALTVAHVVRPAVAAIIALGLGGLAAELIWRVASR